MAKVFYADVMISDTPVDWTYRFKYTKDSIASEYYSLSDYEIVDAVMEKITEFINDRNKRVIYFEQKDNAAEIPDHLIRGKHVMTAVPVDRIYRVDAYMVDDSEDDDE